MSLEFLKIYLESSDWEKYITLSKSSFNLADEEIFFKYINKVAKRRQQQQQKLNDK